MHPRGATLVETSSKPRFPRIHLRSQDIERADPSTTQQPSTSPLRQQSLRPPPHVETRAGAWWSVSLWHRGTRARTGRTRMAGESGEWREGHRTGAEFEWRADESGAPRKAMRYTRVLAGSTRLPCALVPSALRTALIDFARFSFVQAPSRRPTTSAVAAACLHRPASRAPAAARPVVSAGCPRNPLTGPPPPPRRTTITCRSA